MRLKDYERLLAVQNGVCAICGNAPGDRHFGILTVDHDHKTGKVRGLLYNECNVGLGRFKEDVALLGRAIEYLKQSSDSR